MNSSDYRNRDFVALCAANIRHARFAGSTEPTINIVRRTIMSPAPSFYISFDRARSQIYRLLRIPSADRPRQTTAQARLADITDRVERHLSRHHSPADDATSLHDASLHDASPFTHSWGNSASPFTPNVTEALTAVLTSPAPRFYLTPAYALRLYRASRL